MDAVVILVALIAGLIFRRFNYPPLLGYLLSGFVAHELGIGSVENIAPFADIGILLLLFTIGLKLNLKSLAAPHVWGTASLHMVIAVVLTVPVIMAAGLWMPALAINDSIAIWTLAFALSFSSTVFAVKIFDERGESTSLHASIAIGILIIQDLFAVCYLVFTADKAIEPSAIILLALPLIRPALLYLMRLTGHGELLVLFGVVAAVGAAELFELFNLKGGLGALLFGVLLGNTEKSNELYKNLLNLKDLFLIGFFLQIGYYGLPSIEMLFVALTLALLIFLRPIIYYFVLVAFRLRSRTSFLTGIALFNYSEFGLIVGAIAVGNGLLSAEWLTTIALAMSISFFISTPFNTRVHDLFSKYSDGLHRYERKQRLEQEALPCLADSKTVILGGGRVGLGTYEMLSSKLDGKIVCVDEKQKRVDELNQLGVNCIRGDASDYEFWRATDLVSSDKIFVCLSNHHENLHIVNMAKQLGYNNVLAVVSRFPDEQLELQELGCIAFNLYAEAGHGFAEHVLTELDNVKM
ncbi:MAG: cation:proton antiporter [Gammaproteobacteria bacterium]|nr:cation:proton antiporter [Gammaproteobacteria bacterium]